MSDDLFYQNLPPFSDFLEVTNKKHYFQPPHSWKIVITDIRGSTRAIESGKYKDVNVVGAATIIAALNSIERSWIPFVFGGDGSTLLAPSSKISQIVNALCRVQKIAEEEFGLNLRVGIVPVDEILALGLEVQVAKYEIAQGSFLAMLSGDGFIKAEKLVKSANPDSPYLAKAIEPNLIAPTSRKPEEIFAGLECRWNPIPSRNGSIVSLIVQAADSKNAERILKEVLLDFKLALQNRANHPSMREKLPVEWPPKNIEPEIKFKVSSPSSLIRKIYWAKTMTWTWIAWFLVKIFRLQHQSKGYLHDLESRSDYKKVDQSLRLILDLSENDFNNLLIKLKSRSEKGEIVFGYHKSNHALMTCLVFSGENHIHFIDGGSGGYALAAKMLKQTSSLV